MNKNLGTLTAVLALLAFGGCGKQDATGQPPAGSSTKQSDAGPGASLNESLAENGVAPDVAEENTAPETSTDDEPEVANHKVSFDAKNSSFSLDGKTVVLKNGVSSVPAAPGSASSITTRYFGKAAHGDLTQDGKEDVAYFVTRDGPGSGRFYYVVAAINGKNGYKTTNAFLVGDRIEPQSLRINSNELQANFVGRGKDEPMTAPPSRQSVLLLKVNPRGVLEGLMK
jgi:predicted small lipoprotein YifL